MPEYISSFLQDVSPRKTSSPRVAVGNQKALEQCICLNKRLSLESKTLKQQLNSAENEAAYLTGENESLKKEIEELERGKTLIRCNIFGNIYRMIRGAHQLSYQYLFIHFYTAFFRKDNTMKSNSSSNFPTSLKAIVTSDIINVEDDLKTDYQHIVLQRQLMKGNIEF